MAPALSPGGRSGAPRRRLQRQDCLPDKNGSQVTRHASTPTAGTSSQSLQSDVSVPVLQKHSSYPSMVQAKTNPRRRTTSPPPAPPSEPPRSSHTPALRAGPPLSCNFCWNTVDESGRILRRKTQFHCPECRTNLCIVPCFQMYHDCMSGGV